MVILVEHRKLLFSKRPQYNYRVVLQIEEPERILYLAVPRQIYDKFFNRTLTRAVVEQQELKLMVFDIEKEQIVQWIE